MKRILLGLLFATLLLPALPKAEAHTDVSIDFFYNNLGNDGSWVEVGDYGYGWQPSVAVTNRNWRPYADGYWAYTDVGWTWVSYEDFGWATYHYGRWTRVRDRGWFWIPGTEWGPAWVSWRTGGDAVGWAPLPARGRGEEVYEGRPINGYVDLDYNIGPEYYNFVDVRYIGEPVLRDRIYDIGQNYGYIGRTVNVTNITYRDSQVYNYGPDYNTLSGYSTRPIQRLTLQRDLGADFRSAAQNGTLTRVQGDRLFVAAPQTLQKPTTALAPKVVKEKIAQPTIDRGWGNNKDAKVEKDLREKMKSEDLKNVPPVTIPRRAEGQAATAPAASPVPAQAEHADGKKEHGRTGAPKQLADANAPESGVPAADRASARVGGKSEQKGKGKGKEKRVENAPPFAPSGSAVPVEQKPAKEKGKQRRPERNDAAGSSGGAEETGKPAVERPAVQQNYLHPKRERDPLPANNSNSAVGDGGASQSRGIHQRERAQGSPDQGRPGPADQPPSRGGGRAQRSAEDRGPAPEAAGRGDGARKAEGERKKKHEKEEPAPPDQ